MFANVPEWMTGWPYLIGMAVLLIGLIVLWYFLRQKGGGEE